MGRFDDVDVSPNYSRFVIPSNKLRCWCAEAGKCECTPECFSNCDCINDYVEQAVTTPCKCVMFPATQEATGYLTNTHDVLRRGAR